MRPHPTIGILVNPVAGVGGMLALHGSDDLSSDVRRRALADGLAGRRMLRALRPLRLLLDKSLEFVTPSGVLGGDLLKELGWQHRVLDLPIPALTSAADTTAAATQLWAEGVDLLLFAGGDGTAIDIAGVARHGDVALGVPAGVKMHSGVFALTPEVAARLAAAFLRAAEPRSEQCDVLDARPDSQVRPITTLRVPCSRSGLQRAKASGRAASVDELPGLGRAVAAAYRPDETWLLGPGGTVGHVAAALGVPHTTAGVDIVVGGAVAHADATEEQLFAAVSTAARVVLVLGVVGGQGFLLGRGNQQLSARVLERIAVADVHILAAEDKVVALDPPILLVDCADGTDETTPLSGYHAVRTSPHRRLVMKVTDARMLP